MTLLCSFGCRVRGRCVRITLLVVGLSAFAIFCALTVPVEPRGQFCVPDFGCDEMCYITFKDGQVRWKFPDGVQPGGTYEKSPNGWVWKAEGNIVRLRATLFSVQVEYGDPDYEKRYWRVGLISDCAQAFRHFLRLHYSNER